MVISHKHKFIFLEKPKVASCSIRVALQKISDVRWVHDKGKRHGGIKVSLKHFPESANYFKFAFTRNPWDLELSYYIWLKSMSGHKKRYQENSITFEEHINSKMFNKMPTFLSFSSFFKGQINVDFVGRFENLQEDFDKICSQIGIPSQTLSTRNKTKREHYSSYYNKETMNMVAKKHEKDIEIFGYEFEEPFG